MPQRRAEGTSTDAAMDTLGSQRSFRLRTRMWAVGGGGATEKDNAPVDNGGTGMTLCRSGRWFADTNTRPSSDVSMYRLNLNSRRDSVIVKDTEENTMRRGNQPGGGGWARSFERGNRHTRSLVFMENRRGGG